MNFLRRILGRSTRLQSEVGPQVPNWADALPPKDFEYLTRLVQKEHGRRRVPTTRRCVISRAPRNSTFQV
jgi:hypothetical protein